MTLYLVAGVGASTDTAAATAVAHGHLPSRRVRRYPSDTTDAEWAVLAPLVPAGGPGPRGGRPPVHSRRDIIDAIRYVAHNGGVWRGPAGGLPPPENPDPHPHPRDPRGTRPPGHHHPPR